MGRGNDTLSAVRTNSYLDGGESSNNELFAESGDIRSILFLRDAKRSEAANDAAIKEWGIAA